MFHENPVLKLGLHLLCENGHVKRKRAIEKTLGWSKTATLFAIHA